MQNFLVLKTALEKILAIEYEYNTDDWSEIDKAREIAKQALIDFEIPYVKTGNFGKIMQTDEDYNSLKKH